MSTIRAASKSEHGRIPPPNDASFQQFTTLKAADLRRIASATRREYRTEDVIHEAWLMAYDLGVAQGEPLDLLNSDTQDKLLRHLFKHLVHYTEQKVRNAVRLDHAPAGSKDDEGVHPLSYMLASNGGRNVLDELIETEADLATERGVASHGSLAAAYVYLLRHFDNKMATVADHLRISRSHAYRCCAKAQWLSAYAMHIPIPIDEHFLPGPWRSFRLHRPQIQLTLDFGDERLI